MCLGGVGAEVLLRDALLRELDQLDEGQELILKLSLPEEDNFYSALVAHPKVMRVVALSGGYSQNESCARLSRNSGVIASFSRALTTGLSADLSDQDFHARLDQTIAQTYEASLS